MENTDKNTSPVTGQENLFRKLLRRSMQVSEPKLHVTCASTSEVGMNAEDHKEVFIPTGFPLQKLMLRYYHIRKLCGFREQVRYNNGTLALTDLQCTTERQLQVPKIAHLKIINFCVTTLHCIKSILVLLSQNRTKISTSHNTLCFTCFWTKPVANKTQYITCPIKQMMHDGSIENLLVVKSGLLFWHPGCYSWRTTERKWFYSVCVLSLIHILTLHWVLPRDAPKTFEWFPWSFNRGTNFCGSW